MKLERKEGDEKGRCKGLKRPGCERIEVKIDAEVC